MSVQAKTHCIYGHPLSGPNLWLRKDGRRICAECNRRRCREAYRRLFPVVQRPYRKVTS